MGKQAAAEKSLNFSPPKLELRSDLRAHRKRQRNDEALRAAPFPLETSHHRFAFNRKAIRPIVGRQKTFTSKQVTILIKP